MMDTQVESLSFKAKADCELVLVSCILAIGGGFEGLTATGGAAQTGITDLIWTAGATLWPWVYMLLLARRELELAQVAAAALIGNCLQLYAQFEFELELE